MMKSIGFLWKSHQDRDDYCQKCPHGKGNVSTEQNEPTHEGDKTFEFQVNLWNTEVVKVTDKSHFRFRAIDFGVVCPLETLKLIFLFPFKVEKRDFQDLVKCLSLDTDLLCTVFNENLKSTSEPAKSYHKIDGENIHYLMYELAKENIESLEYDDAANVTKMVIGVNTNFDNNDDYKGYLLYIRFRLMLKSFSPFAKKKKISNDWLQSAFSSTYLFDIRLNDVRELSKKKKEQAEFEGFRLPIFRKVHFYYMADSEETVENGSSIKLDKRLLENERWHNYLGDNIEFVSENIAHHWKSKMKYNLGLKSVDTSDMKSSKFDIESKTTYIKNFTLFFKTEFSDYNIRRVGIYVTIVVALSMLASAITSLINCIIPDDSQSGWVIWVGVVACVVLMLYVLYKGANK